MSNEHLDVIGGIDTHADSHAAAVIDAQGKLLEIHEFPATATGCQQLAEWLHRDPPRDHGHGPSAE